RSQRWLVGTGACLGVLCRARVCDSSRSFLSHPKLEPRSGSMYDRRKLTIHRRSGRRACKRVPVPVTKNAVDLECFNRALPLPYNLRPHDFQMAMQDVYDFFFDVNQLLEGKGLERLDDMLRPAIMSGLLSDMLTASLAKHS